VVQKKEKSREKEFLAGVSCQKKNFHPAQKKGARKNDLGRIKGEGKERDELQKKKRVSQQARQRKGFCPGKDAAADREGNPNRCRCEAQRDFYKSLASNVRKPWSFRGHALASRNLKENVLRRCLRARARKEDQKAV